jgi:hypothetical protein
MVLSTILGVSGALAITTYVIKKSKGKGDIDLADEEDQPQGKAETA